jgi:hypothetical protein
MKKSILIILISCVCLCCNSKKQTAKAPKTNFVYKTGSLTYSFPTIKHLHEEDTLNFTILKLEQISSAMLTNRIMYENFGMWDHEIQLSNHEFESLVWNNIKLFDDVNTKFTIIAGGEENKNESFAYIIVLDENQKDYLQEDEPLKIRITRYYLEKIEKIDKSTDFYMFYKDYMSQKKK